MSYRLVRLLILCVWFIALAPADLLAEGTKQSPITRGKHSRLLGGVSAHSAIAGGGSLPKGVLTTAYNVNFFDKTNAKRGYKGPDIFSQTHLLKIRYGLTNHFEFTTMGGYVNSGSRNPSPSNKPNHVEGLVDQTIAITYAPFQMHQGDPIGLSFSGGLSLPSGMHGDNHIPGSGVWGGRLAVGVGSFITDDIRVDTEVNWSMPFERGNQKVKRGDQYQWNAMARYLLGWFDVGIESVYTHTENGDISTPVGSVNLYNGGREWHVGPSMNFAFDEIDMWVSGGVFFPVMQDMNGPNVVDDMQYHFKIGRAW